MIKVLILEDTISKLNAVVNILLETNLVNLDSIDTVNNALSARKKLRSKSYDMLILDISVPEKLGESPSAEAGRCLLEELNEDDSYLVPRKVVGLTGYQDLARDLEADFKASGVVLVHYDAKTESWHAPLQIQLRQISTWNQAEKTITKDYKTYLGIVCALDVEFDAIQKLPWSFTDINIPGDPTIYIKGSVNISGETREVVAALCPRMGMSAAAITSLKLIETFRPKILAMTGITGAVRGKANLGDVIVAEECWDWGMGKWSKQDGKTVFIPGPHHLSIDSGIYASALRLSRNVKALEEIRQVCEGNKPSNALRVHLGPVASGAAVISTQEMTDHISAQHRKLIGIEMESYGLYCAAAEATLPRPKAVSIKAASDFADDQKDDNYRYFCASASAQVLKYLIENGID